MLAEGSPADGQAAVEPPHAVPDDAGTLQVELVGFDAEGGGGARVGLGHVGDHDVRPAVVQPEQAPPHPPRRRPGAHHQHRRSAVDGHPAGGLEVGLEVLGPRLLVEQLVPVDRRQEPYAGRRRPGAEPGRVGRVVRHHQVAVAEGDDRGRCSHRGAVAEPEPFGPEHLDVHVVMLPEALTPGVDGRSAAGQADPHDLDQLGGQPGFAPARPPPRATKPRSSPSCGGGRPRPGRTRRGRRPLLHAGRPDRRAAARPVRDARRRRHRPGGEARDRTARHADPRLLRAAVGRRAGAAQPGRHRHPADRGRGRDGHARLRHRATLACPASCAAYAS